MRILLAINDSNTRRRLRHVFHTRAVTDATEDTSPETVDYYLRHASSPYQLLIHDNELPVIARQPALARLAFGENMPNSCRIERLAKEEPDETLLKKAYSAVSFSTLSPPGLIASGRISIEPVSRQCKIGGKSFYITPMEKRILEALCLYGAGGATVENIADHLYEADSNVRSIEVIIRVGISKINRKIEEQTNNENAIVRDRGAKKYRIAHADPNIKEAAPAAIQIGPMTFYPGKTLLTLGKNRAKLTTKESELLLALSNCRSIMNKTTIAEQIGSSVESTGIHLVRVRQKMRILTGGNHYILTYHGSGLELSNTPV